MITIETLQALSDNEFNQAIEEAVGWNYEQHPGILSWWRLIYPDGTTGEWKYKEYARAPIPNYVKDLNAVWELCKELSVSITQYKDEDVTYALLEVGEYGEYEYRAWEYSNENPARALATSWYAWKLWKDS